MIECPMNDWECPYYEDGNCFIDNPKEDCDGFYDPDEWESDLDDEDFDEEGYILTWGGE